MTPDDAAAGGVLRTAPAPRTGPAGSASGPALKRPNPKVLAAGGVGAVALLALLMKSRGSGGAAMVDSSTGAPVPANTGQAGGSAGAYDSTASDLYNSLQPEIDKLSSDNTGLSGQLADLLDRFDQLPTGTPTPSTPDPATPSGSTWNPPVESEVTQLPFLRPDPATVSFAPVVVTPTPAATPVLGPIAARIGASSPGAAYSANPTTPPPFGGSAKRDGSGAVWVGNGYGKTNGAVWNGFTWVQR